MDPVANTSGDVANCPREQADGHQAERRGHGEHRPDAADRGHGAADERAEWHTSEPDHAVRLDDSPEERTTHMRR